MQIEIPEVLIAQIPKMAAAIRATFRNMVPDEQLVGAFFYGKRFISVYASECCMIGNRQRKRIYSTYDAASDKIAVYRSLVERDQISVIATERILAHELAHALDRGRVRQVVLPAKMNRETRLAYACTTTEFEAEMASIIQIGIPHILRRPDAPRIVADYFGKGGVFPMSRYRRLRDLTFLGYVSAWMRIPTLCNEFFQRFSEALMAALTYYTESCAIISACSTNSRTASRSRILVPA